MLAMMLSAADPDWDVAEDWAPMPELKDETPSQVSMYSDDESGIPELQGIVVNIKDLRGQIYVASDESLTLTTVDDDETMSDSEDGLSEDSDSTDELPDDYDNQNELNTIQDKDAPEEQDGGTMASTLDKEDETMTENQQQNEQQSTFLETYTLNGEEQLQKVSELAKSATDRAAEAGKQISSFLFGGLHMGMAGMVKHLESIEQAVQNQMEQTQAAETRDSAVTSRSRATEQRDKETLVEKKAGNPVTASNTKSSKVLKTSKQNSFEQSTVSSMGDTFQEYFKSRLLHQRRLQQQQQNGTPSSKANEKRIFDFDEACEKPNGREKKQKKAGTTKKAPAGKKVVNLPTVGTTSKKHSAQPKSPTTQSKTITANSPHKRSISRGRQRSFSRSRSKVETRSPGASRGREGRSRSRHREELSRSRSRPRARSTSRKEEEKVQKQETPRPSKNEPVRPISPRRAVQEKKQNAAMKGEVSKLNAKHILERGRSTTKKVIHAPRGKIETNKQSLPRISERGFADTGMKSRGRSTSRPPPERKSEEGVEMVPFTAKSGASGLLIINSGQCNLSTTPKAIRDSLQGKNIATRGRSKTPQQAKRPAKSPLPLKKSGTSIWNLRKEPSMAGNRRHGASNKLAGKVMMVDSRKINKIQAGSNKRNNKEASASPDDLDEMVDAITKFRLTAKKLGVAEDDLLQAMSFATMQNEGDH